MSQSSTMQQNFSIINVAASGSPNPPAMVAIASAIRPMAILDPQVSQAGQPRFSLTRASIQGASMNASVLPLIGATLLTHVGAISVTLCGRVQINIPVLPDNDSVISL